MNQRPDLTAQFPAIDGIAKPERDHYRTDDCMGNDVTRFKPAEDAIREDVAAIIDMPNDKFELWYKNRRNALRTLQNLFSVATDVPDLYYSNQQLTFGQAKTCFSSLLESFEKAQQHLELIKERRGELRRVRYES